MSPVPEPARCDRPRRRAHPSRARPYAAFLRGVSPMTVKLPELKRALEAAGFTDVREVGRHVGTWRDSHRTPAGGATMKFAILIYTDSRLLDALPAGQFDDKMRDCLAHADELRAEGRLFDSQMLQPAATAKSVRVRGGRRTVVDGPFTETKEMLAGFNLIEARDLDDAVRIAAEFPWVETGCVEVRALQDIKTVRQRVGSA